MGTVPLPDVAEVLFTQVQQRVLGLLFGQPRRRFQSAEIIRLAESGTGAVHRMLGRLQHAGLVVSTRVGNQKHYQANPACPVYDDLCRLIAKTIPREGNWPPLDANVSRRAASRWTKVWSDD